MEEIIQILIFVGAMVIAVVGQNAKNKKKPATASPQEVLEDMFPEIKDIQETSVVEPQPTPNPAPAFKKTIRKNPTKPQGPPQKMVQSPPAKQEKKIRLNNREEAKRAFIYSEIFNRKYQ